MKKLLTSILSLTLFCSLCVPAITAEESKIDPDTFYSIVNTVEWQEEMGREERLAAVQIPDSLINSLSTEDLLALVLANPFMIELYCFDSYEAAFAQVYDQIPALAALTERDDFGDALVNYYESIPTENARTFGSDDKSVMDLLYLEVLVAQPKFTDALDDCDVVALAQVAEQKSQDSVNAGNYSTLYDALEENPNSQLARATVYTPNGSAVTVINNRSITDFSSTQKRNFNSETLRTYPTATNLADASKKYNCHSYAWYSHSTSNYYWMDDPSAYMRDGSYTKTTSSDNGNRVYWSNRYGIPEHSGILSMNMQASPWISANSKWGQLGVYNHPLDDCPYYEARTYWRK